MKSVTEKGLGSTFAKATADKKERGGLGREERPFLKALFPIRVGN